jgi:hypothetical protein
MDVKVNDKVQVWMSNQGKAEKNTFNTKCTEAINDDLSTWQLVGKSVYHYRVTGNFRAVATKSGKNFNVAAIYKHGENGGKVLETGQTVKDY